MIKIEKQDFVVYGALQQNRVSMLDACHLQFDKYSENAAVCNELISY